VLPVDKLDGGFMQAGGVQALMCPTCNSGLSAALAGGENTVTRR